MTTFEEEMILAVWKARFSSDPKAGGLAAAEVAKKYIEKAFEDGYWAVANYGDDKDMEYENSLKEGDETDPIEHIKNRWLKENGIV